MTKKTPKPKVAYYVDDGDDSADIKFVHSKNQLLRNEEWTEIERKPEYDRFAHLGYVPPEILIDDGWWIPCYECDLRIDGDFWDYEEDVRINPVFKGRNVYCSQACCDTAQQKREAYQKDKAECIAAVIKFSPDAANICFYGNGTVEFKLPCCKYRIRWNKSDPDHVSVIQCDVEAWKVYQDGVKNKQSETAIAG